jgi:predicted ATPase
MLSKVSIQNFKSLRDVQIDLERFTVFVGPNASGKSSILQAISAICQAFQVDNPQTLEPVFEASLSKGSQAPLELRVECDGKWYRYCGTHPAPPTNGNPIVSAMVSRLGRSIGAFGPRRWEAWQREVPGQSPLPIATLLTLDAAKLANENIQANDPSIMLADGSGIHSALVNMALHDQESWLRLQADLRRIIPTIRRVRHSKVAKQGQPHALLFDMVGADAVPAYQVSEGTLLLLGLLTALYSPSRPELILLDDLDKGLHPRAQRELVGLLRGFLDTNNSLQILATTHSPYLLGSMEPNEVRMTHLNDAGATACDSLTHHPKFAKWKDEMSAGEMWSLFGEKWVVGQEVPA